MQNKKKKKKNAPIKGEMEPQPMADQGKGTPKKKERRNIAPRGHTIKSRPKSAPRRRKGTRGVTRGGERIGHVSGR